MKTLLRLLPALLVALFTCTASSQVIMVHTGYSNPASAWQDDQGRWWNRLGTWQATTKTNLIDNENTVTPVTWKTTARFSYFQANGPVNDPLFGYPNEVSSNGFHQNPGDPAAVVVFENLDVTQSYDLTFYGATITEASTAIASRALNITVAGGAGSASQLLLLTAPNPGTSVFNEITFSNLRPDNDGKFQITFDLPEGYKRGTINAITLAQVPEPGAATLLLIPLGAFALMRLRPSR